jgi:hypothetical protein
MHHEDAKMLDRDILRHSINIGRTQVGMRCSTAWRVWCKVEPHLLGSLSCADSFDGHQRSTSHCPPEVVVPA